MLSVYCSARRSQAQRPGCKLPLRASSGVTAGGRVDRVEEKPGSLSGNAASRRRACRRSLRLGARRQVERKSVVAADAGQVTIDLPSGEAVGEYSATASWASWKLARLRSIDRCRRRRSSCRDRSLASGPSPATRHVDRLSADRTPSYRDKSGRSASAAFVGRSIEPIADRLPLIHGTVSRAPRNRQVLEAAILVESGVRLLINLTRLGQDQTMSIPDPCGARARLTSRRGRRLDRQQAETSSFRSGSMLRRMSTVAAIA